MDKCIVLTKNEWIDACNKHAFPFLMEDIERADKREDGLIANLFGTKCYIQKYINTDKEV